MLQSSPSFWNKGDIIRNSNGSIVAYTTPLKNSCPTQMVNWTLEENLKYDKNLETKSRCSMSRWVHHKRKNNRPPKSTPTPMTSHHGANGRQIWSQPRCWLEHLGICRSWHPNYFPSGSWRTVGVMGACERCHACILAYQHYDHHAPHLKLEAG